MNNIKGLTYQTFIEVTAAIESAEHRRRLNPQYGAEHPRASTTDDVEAFFSTARRLIGEHFTLKDFRAKWPKIVQEFCKKIDPNLPFYYWVGPRDDVIPFDANDEVEIGGGDHNYARGNGRLEQVRGNRREQAAADTYRRADQPRRHARPLRRAHHQPVAPLPAPNLQLLRP